MQVKGTQSEEVTIDLSKSTIKEIVLEQIYKLYNLERDAYIKDGNLMYDIEEYGGSHSWFDTHTVREATEEDIAVVMVLKKLRREL